VITAFSSDGRISEYDLVTLGDPLAAIPPYDAILLLAPGRSDDTALTRALQPMIGKIPVERMREANLMVSRETDQVPPAEAARRLWAAVTK
jgi:osmoprotectant transport system permease protein